MKRLLTLVILAGLFATSSAFAEPLFHSTDPLAQHDDWGVLHNSPVLNSTDLDGRYRWRWVYYFKVPAQLVVQPAYVGALQDALRRRGYYCGEIDGVFSGEVSDAIARMQKNYSMRVTGTLTEPVQRALHLP